MHGDSLELALVFLIAAVVMVPLFRRFGLGAVLGYLVAGIAIGPSGLGVVGDPERVMAASELGVVMMLFVIGLELSLARLKLMRRAVFGAGALQVLACGLVLGMVPLLGGFGWRTDLVIGLGLALSSTAVGLQLIAERRELTSPYGRLAFAILLFQDLAAVPLLAAIPLLGSAKAAAQLAPSWHEVGLAVGVIALVVVGGRYVLRYVFRIVARARTSELLTATALLVVVGNAWLMEQAGLSMGLGAFLAGVLLADSEFRHELESQVEPFKGLLLGLFFIAVGMSVDLAAIAAEPWLIAGGVLGLLAAKALLLWAIGRLFGLDGRGALMLAAALALGGEFSFVMFSEALEAGLIDAAMRVRLIAIVGLSMAATPLALIAVGGWLRRRSRQAPPPAEPLPDDFATPRVVIAGFGRVGQLIGRMLRAAGIGFIALEHSVEQVAVSRRYGNPIHYGDPERIELLRAADVGRAEVFVVAIDDPDSNLRVARLVKRHYPHLRVLARARNRQHAFRLMDLGAEQVRESFHSSLEMGERVLTALGMPAERAASCRRRFHDHDEALLARQQALYEDDGALVASTRDAQIQLEELFAADMAAEADGRAAPRRPQA
ncbi:monovalent cation:proton antiporter-2 (CPA2) family protein [Coralloluteibacterium stylophorae]|uniref:Monovalent cation:proton antiporter-2 (CPA2) family protein n=1 Tax=Coralloluteibacterium stylophorae TaxID=1776034 RepID=A0A8J7VSW0_9GAMM|nr:monovalent cation:proton antiporter-2 (CPA2) family protein [Coralloluteibacterium stylophorae]MBS7457036.1 monovalent cation:proton antiporter-2 (CPA2) family protein [Coralloluteibacterium stylophorae]